MRGIFLVLIMAIPVAGYANESCEEKWPGNYRMQKYCIEQQNKGAAAINAYMDHHGITEENFRQKLEQGDVATEILANCAEKWGKNQRMVNYCLEQQTKAARELGKLK